MVIAEYNIYIPTVAGRRSWDYRECCATDHGSDVIRTTECQLEMMMFRQLNSPWFRKEGYTITSFPRYLKEKGRKVPELCCFTRVLLAWGALYGAKKAHGATFVPFYSAKKENVLHPTVQVVSPT